MTLSELKAEWEDHETFHKEINDYFVELVNNEPAICSHRDFVEKGYGFGERSFWWLWKLLCDEMPEGFSFLEIGCYKGATISLIKLLRPDATVHTVTPLSGEDGYGEADYALDVKNIHKHFNLEQPHIIHGLSTEEWAIKAVNDLGKWNIIYLDGGHSYETVLLDLNNYAPMVKTGGYLVMDDANVDINLPWGYFRGHSSVTDAKLKWLETQNDFEFICSVVHIAVFKRK